MTVSAIALPPPFALARPTDTLTPAGVREPRYEMKWDGYRAAAAGGRLWSRRGTDLTRLFPDLAPLLAARLPASAVIDAEIIAWDVEAGRLDFAGLQARMTAGRRLAAVAARRPAHLVCFDLLAIDDQDLRGRPLSQRRELLADLLVGVGAPIALCEQTAELATAEEWLGSLGVAGIEGVVIKDAAAPYPTRAGQRVWRVDCTNGVVEDRVSVRGPGCRNGLRGARATPARPDERDVLAVACRHGLADGSTGRTLRAA